jgi:PPK2 family polyphosphate:nucleotide phosphotransferase
VFKAVDSPYLVPDDGSFSVAEISTRPPEDVPGEKKVRKRLKRARNELSDLQEVLYADDRHAVLLIFQALDAAGKDSTIRAVLTGVNPAGCQVYSFKVPSAEELDHDFLWRTTRALPERGRIGVFNRSYYEEVLVVRVHPEILLAQKLPVVDTSWLWQERYKSICDHEQHLAQNGTVILKFWLNISAEEQRRRFLARLDKSEKNWKFSLKDVEERQYWDEYVHAYEEVLNRTSRPWAPWYAIPADDKPYMRMKVAEIVVESLKQLDLKYPSPSPEDQARFESMRRILTPDSESE